MPSWLQALILGIVQGLTEFVPVSSSGHLVVVPAYFGWERPGLAFDVALHVGTALALVVYYRRELWGMAAAVLGRGPTDERRAYRRLAGLLALASVPIAVVGATLRSLVEDAFDSPALTSGLLLVTAVVLVAGERLRARRLPAEVAASDDAAAVEAGAPDHDVRDPAGTTLPRMRARQALIVGVGQALALLPGLSRSGLTITAGLAAGLTRPAATRFAFLLAFPAIVGATLISLPGLRDLGESSGVDLAVGMAAAAVAGYVAIAGLVRLVARAGLDRFAPYLAVVGVVGLVVFT